MTKSPSLRTCPSCRNVAQVYEAHPHGLPLDLLPKRDGWFITDADIDHVVWTSSTALRSAVTDNRCPFCTSVLEGLTLLLGLNEISKEGVEVQIRIWIRVPLPLKVTWSASRIIVFIPRSVPGTTDPSPIFGPARTVASYSDSAECFELITQWIHDCDSSHPACKAHEKGGLPKRVVDVRSTGINPRLYVSRKELEPYLTLSHCWGKKQIIHTTKATLETFQSGIPWQLLSKTFQDAVSITRRLGVRYIWIDSLCIVQDDNQDWQTESAQMANIYRNSHLNIAATRAPDGDGGCFHKRPSASTSPMELASSMREGGPSNMSVREELPYHNVHTPFQQDVFSYPLHTRAWVFQERLLAPRTVQYTNSELYWECSTRSQCECTKLDEGFPFRKENTFKKTYKNALDTQNPEELNEYWTRLLSEYSKLQLTYESDRLPAISGVAQKFLSRQLGTYLAGLWSDYLHKGLLWWSPVPRFPFDGASYQAPSWSWASLSGRVNYDFGGERPRNPVSDFSFIDILEAQSTPAGQDPTGQVSAGFIRVRGPVVRVSYGNSAIDIGKRDLLDMQSNGTAPELYLDRPIHTPSTAGPGEQLYCLRVRTVNYGFQVPLPINYERTASLILIERSATEKIYERVGIIFQGQTDDVENLYHNAERRTITII